MIEDGVDFAAGLQRSKAARLCPRVGANPSRGAGRIQQMQGLRSAVEAGRDVDRALLVRIGSGDASALRALYDRAAPQVLALALRVLRDRRDAEEVLQDTFVDLWRRAGSFDPARGSAAAFLMSIARSRAIDRLRSRGAGERAHAGASAEPADAVAQPLELAEAREARGTVQRALEQLSPQQRAAIELAYFEGLTQREIADRTGDPLGTVKTRVRAALQKLSTLLSGEAAP